MDVILPADGSSDEDGCWMLVSHKEPGGVPASRTPLIDRICLVSFFGIIFFSDFGAKFQQFQLLSVQCQ